jgi:proteic killer suppression protein
MIISFRDKRTRELAAGKRVKAFAGFERKAEMKLDQLDAATSLLDLDLPGNRPKPSRATAKANTVSASMTSGGFAMPEGSPGPVNVEMSITIEVYHGTQRHPSRRASCRAA